MKRTVLRLPVERKMPELEYGVVTRADADGLLVELDGVEYPAAAAFSCLVQPIEQDTVLCVSGGRETVTILAVLERHNAAEMETSLNFEGNVALNVKAGKLRLRSDKGLDLASRGRISAVASALSIDTSSLDCTVENLRLEGRMLESSFEETSSLAGKCIETYDFVSQKSRNSVRMVDEHDELQAGSIRQLAEGTITVQARDIMQTAEENVRIDAEKISLG